MTELPEMVTFVKKSSRLDDHVHWGVMEYDVAVQCRAKDDDSSHKFLMHRGITFWLQPMAQVRASFAASGDAKFYSDPALLEELNVPRERWHPQVEADYAAPVT